MRIKRTKQTDGHFLPDTKPFLTGFHPFRCFDGELASGPHEKQDAPRKQRCSRKTEMFQKEDVPTREKLSKKNMFEKQENVPIRVKCTKKEKCTKQIKMGQNVYQEKHSAQGSSAGALSGSQYSSSGRKNNGILYTILVFAGLYLFFLYPSHNTGAL